VANVDVTLSWVFSHILNLKTLSLDSEGVCLPARACLSSGLIYRTDFMRSPCHSPPDAMNQFRH
jgi:hypothetical protein